MAEIISKVSEKIKNAANVTAKKTKTAANIAKLTLQIKMLKADLSACYEKLGEAFYDQVKLDADNDDVVAARIVEAHEIKTEIDSLTAELKKEKAELKKKKDAPIEAEFTEVAEADVCAEECAAEAEKAE
jgi:uncharacterized small protein (DUF1192 family)